MAYYCNGKRKICKNPTKCSGCRHFDFTGGYNKTTTNADRIRAMSDEELAELFGAVLREREIILLKQLEKQGIEASIAELPDETFNAHLEWLKQPAE